MPTKSKWTEEMDNLLRGLLARKAAKSEIMIAFPLKTYNAIYLRMSRLKIDASHLDNPPESKSTWENYKIFRPPETERKCMTCGAPFMSSGPGHRLCMVHRRDSDDGTFAVKAR